MKQQNFAGIAAATAGTAAAIEFFLFFMCNFCTCLVVFHSSCMWIIRVRSRSVPKRSYSPIQCAIHFLSLFFFLLHSTPLTSSSFFVVSFSSSDARQLKWINDLIIKCLKKVYIFMADAGSYTYIVHGTYLKFPCIKTSISRCTGTHTEKYVDVDIMYIVYKD